MASQNGSQILTVLSHASPSIVRHLVEQMRYQ
jgi:hypothetical protein